MLDEVCGRPVGVTGGRDDRGMDADTRRTVNHWELRARLTLHIPSWGPTTVAELVRALEREGWDVGGRTSKVVSDSLRAEVSKGWVRRLDRGIYAPGRLPKSSKSRLRVRVRAARERLGGGPSR